MTEEIVIQIIRENLHPNQLHSKTIEKFYKDYPEVNDFVIKKLQEIPEYITKGYYAIMKVKGLDFVNCPNCGKRMDYERIYKNHKTFCSRNCAMEDRMKKNGTFGKEQRKHNFNLHINYSNQITFNVLNEDVLHELYKNKSTAQIVHLYKTSEQVRDLANKKYENNNNYRTPCNALICICHKIELPKCKCCGKEMKYSIHRNKNQMYCSQKCAKQSNTYVERQQKSRYNNFYNNTVQFAKEKGLTLLTPIEYYKGVTGENLYKCNDCNRKFIFTNSWNIKRDLKCPYCNGGSLFEKEVKEFISKYVDIEGRNKKILDNHYELDIVIPSKKLAVECNGLYWHSSAQNKNCSYHLKKTNECEDKGYNLIHIFEDEWLYRKSAVMNVIKSSLNLNTIHVNHNDCKVSKLGLNRAERFVKKYGLTLDYRNKTNYSITYKNRLIGVVTTSNNTITAITIMKGITINGLEKLITDNFRNYYYKHDKRFINVFNFQFIQTLPPREYFVSGTERFIKASNRKKSYSIYDCGYNLYKIL